MGGSSTKIGEKVISFRVDIQLRTEDRIQAPLCRHYGHGLRLLDTHLACMHHHHINLRPGVYSHGAYSFQLPMYIYRSKRKMACDNAFAWLPKSGQKACEFGIAKKCPAARPPWCQRKAPFLDTATFPLSPKKLTAAASYKSSSRNLYANLKSPFRRFILRSNN